MSKTWEEKNYTLIKYVGKFSWVFTIKMILMTGNSDICLLSQHSEGWGRKIVSFSSAWTTKQNLISNDDDNDDSNDDLLGVQLNGTLLA